MSTVETIVELSCAGGRKKKTKGGSQYVPGSFAALDLADAEEGDREGGGEAPDLENAACAAEGSDAAAAVPEPGFGGATSLSLSSSQIKTFCKSLMLSNLRSR